MHTTHNERPPMTQKQFANEIRRLVRRTQLLRDASNGDVKLRRVDIKRCTVREHTRGAHARLIAPAGWRPRKS